MADRLPVPRRGSAVARRSKLKSEIRRQALEAAAIAAVRMENGEYVYGDDSRRAYKLDENGIKREVWNDSELCRIAGYPVYGKDGYKHIILEDEYFLEMLALHRRRREDPGFRTSASGEIWMRIGDEALKALYQRVTEAPNSLTVEQQLKLVKLVLDAGVLMDRMDKGQDKVRDVLDVLPPQERDKLLREQQEFHTKRAAELSQLSLAHKGADKK